jgi:Flp pilus assembly protein CpaB
MENIMSSKLFTTRQGTVLLGVIAAAIAAIALVVYLNNYRNSHKGGGAISVLVAQKLIQSGTTGDVIRTSAGYYKPTGYAKSQVENGAILDPATLAGKVAITDISPGQQLTAADFGPAGTTVATQLKPNERAVVVSLDSPQQVGGQITHGSHVDVWIAFNGQASNGVSRSIVRELYQNMTVLNAGTSGGNVTLEATSRQAGTLIFASQNATIWLVLRPTIASNDTKGPTIGVNNLLTGPTLSTGR